ncbi:lactococcin 972 family bacteriocin [Clostridium botulinum]|uniref:lactococcin 972 family bacteriocin n=1 Tax=Clostridium botulinum TaxID=1491 RepID=UPI0001F84E07|nr:lactococcin 972 family bacteriocin [Clostridium botulinum]KEI90893.1 hypothetical protein N491_02800 [Clostridium botulinum B2 275]NFB17369.1 hypothetical protein [Clostridium botulinum]NFB68104.1 hypothetical protein [Clostridium botulinum]NFB99360.1 hypothetical protein [Clostridium botulinum]NFC47851.1 hypothetical protein [Clostridium botulinum]
MKKFLISAIIGISAICIMGTSVLATSVFSTNRNSSCLPGSDNWNRGIKSGGNGYYMAYSYYYNPSYDHMAKASLPGSTTQTVIHGPGSTASINSKSRPSITNGFVGAAARKNGSWRYAKDTGSGDYSSGW